LCNYFRTRRAVAVWFFSTLCFSSEAFDGPIYFTRSYTGLARMRVCQCCSSVQSFFAPAAGQPFTSLAQEWLVASRCIGQSALRSCGGDALCKIFSRLRRANLSLPHRKWLSAHYGSSALQQCLKFVSRLRRTNFASRPQDGPVASRCLEQRVLRQWGGDVLRKIFWRLRRANLSLASLHWAGAHGGLVFSWRWPNGFAPEANSPGLRRRYAGSRRSGSSPDSRLESMPTAPWQLSRSPSRIHPDSSLGALQIGVANHLRRLYVSSPDDHREPTETALWKLCR